MINARLFLFFALFAFSSAAFSQTSSLYFPPKIGNAWQTISPASLGFCQERIDSLYRYLQDHNTKSFILLKDGRIVLEKYFGTFVQDSIWYWASAGKSLTAFLVGMAQQDGILDINDQTSKYLGTAWTSAAPDKEALITVKHQISMTTGLQASSADDNCTAPSCLIYKADAGTRWNYHNATYHLVHDVLEKASGTGLNLYTKNKIFDRTGMKGLWVNHIMYSKARDMARYGLLMLANGVWDGDTLLRDKQYFHDMIHSSQDLNKSYGYLWWLNGQPSFMLPSVQFVFPGKLIPNAPNDMYSALGKNDQKIHVVPSKGWVVVRQGNSSNFVGPGGNTVPISFDNVLWTYLDQLVCQPTTATDEALDNKLRVSPNPSTSSWRILGDIVPEEVSVFDRYGRTVLRTSHSSEVGADALPAGVYMLKVRAGGQDTFLRAIKI